MTGRTFRRLAYSLALCLPLWGLCACAPKVELPRFEEAQTNLAVFRARFLDGASAARGLAARTTLVYSTPRRSNRTDVQLFGDYARPLRLDVRAGLGSMLALMREDGAGLLAYYPEKARAYAHQDPVIGAQLLGMPFPFALRDLALVLAGDFSSLLPKNLDAGSLRPAPGGGFACAFAKGPVRLLVIDAHGRPERLEGMLSASFRTQAEREAEADARAEGRPLPPQPGPRAWSIAFTSYPEEDGDPAGPARVLTLTLPGGESAVLRVRALDQRAEPWPLKSLALPLPNGTGFMALDRQTAPPEGVTEIITGGDDDGHAQPHG